MDDATQKFQPFTDIVAIAPNIILGDPRVQAEEAFHAPRLRENVECDPFFGHYESVTRVGKSKMPVQCGCLATVSA